MRCPEMTEVGARCCYGQGSTTRGGGEYEVRDMVNTSKIVNIFIYMSGDS